MGRTPHDFSTYVKKIDEKRNQCILCGYIFAGGATRSEAHLKGTPGKGIRPCKKSREYLQAESLDFSDQGAKLIEGASVKGSNKRPRTDARAREQGSPSSCSILNEDIKVEREIKDHTHQEISLKMENKEEEPMECRNVTYRGGPLPISNLEERNHRDSKLIEYTLDNDPCLDERDILISFPKFHLTRKEFITLRPGSCLDEMIINIVVEKLTKVERGKQKGHLNWYLPTTFSRYALRDDSESFKSFCVRQKIKETYMSNLKECDKIFIPIHISPNSIGHFYLYVVDLKENVVKIWDSLPELSCADIKKRELNGRVMLNALDDLFKNDARNYFSKGWAFEKFHIVLAKDIPCQINKYDCGMFVIKFMQLSTDRIYSTSQIQANDADDERYSLALSLLKDEMNIRRSQLFEEVAEHCQQDEYLRTEKGADDQNFLMDDGDDVNIVGERQPVEAKHCQQHKENPQQFQIDEKWWTTNLTLNVPKNIEGERLSEMGDGHSQQDKMDVQIKDSFPFDPSNTKAKSNDDSDILRVQSFQRKQSKEYGDDKMGMSEERARLDEKLRLWRVRNLIQEREAKTREQEWERHGIGMESTWNPHTGRPWLVPLMVPLSPTKEFSG